MNYSLIENEISYAVRGAIFKVFRTLGPGLFEKVYIAALEYELAEAGLYVRKEVPLPVIYEGMQLDVGFKIDLLVENKVIIEVKSVERLSKVHHKQILTYLKLTELKLGILVNFNTDNVAEGIFRKVNGL